MHHWAAIVALVLPAVAQEQQPVVLKSTSRVVQLHVLVNDPSGRPVHGLQKADFVVTDNGRPRDIRIFAGEIDSTQTPESPAVFSNRLSMPSAPVVTAIVIDAVPRPEGLQGNGGMFARGRPQFWLALVRSQAISTIDRMEPGQVIAIYAACPELRVIQDFTSDPDRLAASLNAFVPQALPKAIGKNQPQTIDRLVPPMLAVLREVAGRMAEASGRKSVVWISQTYGTELNPSAIRVATDSTAAAFNDANVPLYAVDARFSPACESPLNSRADQSGIVTLNCSQPQDVSDDWMEYLANATGGRAFSGGKVSGVQGREPNGTRWGMYRLDRDDGIVSEALRFAAEDSRYAYEMGFYVPESELDGKFHTLAVTIPAKPRFGVRYRSGYTASPAAPDSKPEAARPLGPDEVGIDARIDVAPGTKNEVRVYLALVPETVTIADHSIALDAIFTETDAAGKQLTKVQESVRVPSPGPQTEPLRYSRSLKVAKGAVYIHIRVRDQATNRVGSVVIPIGKH
jgi:VWFA-related protein